MAGYDDVDYGRRARYSSGYGAGRMSRRDYRGRDAYDRDYGGRYRGAGPSYRGEDRYGGGYRGPGGYDREYHQYRGGRNGSYGGSYESRESKGRYERSRGMAGLYTELDASRPRGRHVGRGPTNYKRSDERIHEDVNEELTQHPELDATHIQVRVSDGVVTLEGTVESREAKRMAEDCVDRVSGVADVQNNLRIQRDQGDARKSTSDRSAGTQEQEDTSASQGVRRKQPRKRRAAGVQPG